MTTVSQTLPIVKKEPSLETAKDKPAIVQLNVKDHPKETTVETKKDIEKEQQNIKIDNKSAKDSHSNPETKELSQTPHSVDEQAVEQKLKKFGVKTEEEVQMEVKRWKKLHKILQAKRSIEQQIQMKKLQQELNQRMEERRRQAQEAQQIKRENIKKKLDQLEKRKQERKQSKIAELQSKKNEPTPLYKEKEKQYMMKKFESEEKIRENILRRKKEMMIDAEELREHQKNYMEQLKKRYEKNKALSERRQKSHQKIDADGSLKGHKRSNSEFTLFIRSDSQRKQKDKQKYLRRKKFEEKVRQMPVLIDQEKMREALIARDKAKNPLKYNYLSNVAALSDDKIYDEFKDFEINIDKNELGNQYMKNALSEVHSLPSRVTKARSQSRLHQSEKAEYKNYLPEIRGILKKRIQGKTPETQVQDILYRFNNKQDQVSELNKKSNTYEYAAIKKIQQLRDVDGYEQCIVKEKDIDQLYMKSLKMKIAGMQIN